MRVLRNVAHAFSSVFGCSHDRLSRPFTIQRQSYMVCLECGQKVFYSMEEMRRLSRREVRRLHAVAPGGMSIAPVAGKLSSELASDPTLAA